MSSDVSIKEITIPSVLKPYLSDFTIGNHNWKQKCMIDPGSNNHCVVMINCVVMTPLIGHTI